MDIEFSMAFPPYRPSHFRSKTYSTLVRILSHVSPSAVPTQSLNIPDNGKVGMGQENQELEPVRSDVMDPKGSIPLKEMHDVHEIGESVGDRSKDFRTNEIVLDDEDSLMGIDEPSSQTNGFHLEQIMDELELVVKGTEDPVCNDGLIPLNCEKQNSGSEVDLMDYRVENVEFLHCGTNTSGIVSEVRTDLPVELNQLDSEVFHVVESTKGKASDSAISTTCINHDSQQKETELVKPVCPVTRSLPTIQESEFEKGEQYGHQVDEVAHSSIDHDKINEALNMTEDGGLLDSTILEDKNKTQNNEKPEKLICATDATNSSDLLVEGDLEEGEISGDFAMDGDTFDVSSAVATISEQMKVDEIQKPGNSFGNKAPPFNAVPTYLTPKQVLHKGFMEETTIKDHGNSFAVQEVIDVGRKRKYVPDSEEEEDKKKEMVDASKSKRGPGSKEKKNKKKKNYRKNRAEKNREQGVKRLKLIPVQKPKTISYCRHYIKGRCNEGDKCKFSHDIVPETKSKACVHFARHSCMKGDDCPFDHQLSKYPCSSMVSNGSCTRGDACLFSHQVPINQCIPTPTNACKPESKTPLPSGNTNFSTPLNNHGSSSVQQNHSTNSKGTDTPQRKPTSAPKGIRFINVANLSSSTPKQDTTTPNKGSLVHNGTCADKGQNTAEVTKKFSAVTPKGINFLSFGKGSVCSFKSSIQSTAQNLPQAALFSHNEISDKNQSIVERMKSKFLEKDSTDDSVRDHSHCKSVQVVKKASDNSQTSNVTSATLLARPFVSHQSSGSLVSGYQKHASNLSQRAVLSTLAFAAEHESGIKMKCPTVDSPV
ncbi:zinc finger CCCH domain-containing protein 65 isoform X1 [Vicia villosa]|uniref:zinc finger CCCH domain-containing protein 65 isoform X1 n=1 Tax=Vicia villosa TaxID=3911 RepID=UPI00273C8F8F|nr:zinc finger CCCH domain-containing protein 65 isoform X1 [Vicia villosa]XP_058788139.1 zinc finger CCCH domain-containing protein 65 isoform X1 [Vicia villosa]